MFNQVDYTMIMVSDMKRSIEFYRDKLGLPLKFESPEWTEFQTGATTLALHGGGVKANHPVHGNGKEKFAGSCSIGFNVENLNQTYQALQGKGVKFIMPPTQQDKEGIKLAVALDPDGMPVSLAEHLQS